MEKENRPGISLFGELKEQALEAEFLRDSLSGARRITAYIALLFGAVLALFLLQSYLTEAGTALFAKTAPLRLAFISVSILVFFTARRITNPRHLVLLITFYQATICLTYLLTLEHYTSLNYFSVIALMVITLALYLLPNRVVFSQLISILFSILFFAFPIRKLAGLQSPELFRIMAYQAILLVYCNINYCWTEAIKRRTFLANMELLDLSSKDPLTGIYNRKKFEDCLEEWIQFSQRYGQPLSVILFDLDNFKGINDSYGHLVGDQVLMELAAAVKRAIRQPDIFARWGGDEFVLLLPNTDLAQAQALAERLRSTIASAKPGGTLEEITCSFGVAQFEEGDTKQSLLSRVDDVLLEGKAQGKDRVVG